MTGIIGIIGVVVGIIGVILTIKSSKKKKLSFLIENSTIFDEKNLVEKLQVSYDHKPLSGFSNAKILIINNGQEAIGGNDISSREPVRVKVSESHEILNVSIEYLGDNRVSINKMNHQEFAIEFDFLNPKEVIVVSFLHDGTPFSEIEFLGRIKGVNNFENLYQKDRGKYYSTIFTLISILSLSMMAVISFFTSILTVILLPTLLIIFCFLFFEYKHRKYINILKRINSNQ